jgi:hypothetical protein
MKLCFLFHILYPLISFLKCRRKVRLFFEVHRLMTYGESSRSTLHLGLDIETVDEDYIVGNPVTFVMEAQQASLFEDYVLLNEMAV